MNVKKESKSSRSRKAAQSRRSKRMPLATQVVQLKKELREVKSQRDSLVREIARRMEPEVDQILEEHGDPLKFAGRKPSLWEVLHEPANRLEE